MDHFSSLCTPYFHGPASRSWYYFGAISWKGYRIDTSSMAWQEITLSNKTNTIKQMHLIYTYSQTSIDTSIHCFICMHSLAILCSYYFLINVHITHISSKIHDYCYPKCGLIDKTQMAGVTKEVAPGSNTTLMIIRLNRGLKYIWMRIKVVRIRIRFISLH